MVTSPGLTLSPFGSYQALIGSSTLAGAGLGSAISPVIPTAAPEVNGAAGLSGTTLGAAGTAVPPSPAIASTLNTPLGAVGSAGGVTGSSLAGGATPSLPGASAALVMPTTSGSLATAIPAAAPGIGVPAVGTTAPPIGGVTTPTAFPIPGVTVTPLSSAVEAAAVNQTNALAAGVSPVAAASGAVALPPTVPASAATSGAGAAQVFQATLDPINNSGVHGSATITLSGQMLTVDLQASGLQPGQIHPQYIDTMAGGGADRMPTAADDVNHDGFIDQTEAMSAIGAPVLDLSLDPSVTASGTPVADRLAIFPVAAADGTVIYHEVFAFNSGQPAATAAFTQLTSHLAAGAVVLDGMTVHPPGLAGGAVGYLPQLPVAVGLLHETAGPPIG